MPESNLDNQKENVGKRLNYLSINKDESMVPNTKGFNSEKEGYEKQGTILLDDDSVVSSDDDDDDLNDFRKDKTVEKIKKLNMNLPLTANDEKLYPQVRTLIVYGWFRRQH
jgi:hypothetical protein